MTDPSPSSSGASAATRPGGEAPAPRPTRGWKVAVGSWLGASMIRVLGLTCRLRHHGDGAMREREHRGEPQILAFWHRNLLLMPYSYRGRGIAVLISQHRDGELIARAIERLGLGTVRGSSTRGGVAGLRALLREVRRGRDLGVTPDGPKGPAGKVKHGVIQAAARSGAPIQPIALAASRGKNLDSWDRFLIPWPFSRVHFVYGEALRVDRDDDVARAAEELERRIDGAERRALELAGQPVPNEEGRANA